jgi:hypothetical protein
MIKCHLMLLQSYSGFKLKHSQALCIKLENVYKLNLCYSNIESYGKKRLRHTRFLITRKSVYNSSVPTSML